MVFIVIFNFQEKESFTVKVKGFYCIRAKLQPPALIISQSYRLKLKDRKDFLDLPKRLKTANKEKWSLISAGATFGQLLNKILIEPAEKYQCCLRLHDCLFIPDEFHFPHESTLWFSHQSKSSTIFNFTEAKRELQSTGNASFKSKSWVSVFQSFKSLLLFCLTLRQLNLERVNPGELGITNAESQHETWEDETWTTTTTRPPQQHYGHVSSDSNTDKSQACKRGKLYI